MATPGGRRRVPRLTSVVLPVKNGGALLDQQLDALAAQDHAGPWELVVADNGSADGTALRAAARSATFPVPCSVVDVADRRGCAGARNGGAEAASGDLLAFCDADDVVEPGWLAALVAAADGAGVVGGLLRTDVLNPPEVAALRPREEPSALPVALGWRPYATGANLAVWRDVHDALDGFDEDLTSAEDVDYSWRAQLQGHLVVRAPDAVVHYRFRHGLRALARQYTAYGAAEPELFRAFAPHGLPRRPARLAVRQVLWLVKHLPDLARGPVPRGSWVREAAYAWGRAKGSVRSRTLYV